MQKCTFGNCNQKLTKLILCSWAFVFAFASVFFFVLAFVFVFVFAFASVFFFVFVLVFVILGPLSSHHLLKNVQSLYNDDTTSRSWPFQITFGHFFENSQSNEDFLNAKWQLSERRPCLRMKSELSSLFFYFWNHRGCSLSSVHSELYGEVKVIEYAGKSHVQM